MPLRRERTGLRRLASAGLAATAVAAGLHVLAPGPAATVPAVVLTRDRPGGVVLGPGDLRTEQRPPATVPRGSLTLAAASGRVLAAGARAGEVLTDVRLVGPGLLAGQDAGLVGAPVRVADPAAAALAAPGDRVDVLLATTARRDAEVVVRSAIVLARPTPARGELLGPTETGGGALLVLAVGASDAAALAGAAARGPLSITFHAGLSEPTGAR
ncbi:MAG: hypothetical protein H7231_10910 [Rhodoferax sp.]|nr:hypothetical protein [Actinomycetota bacterium]